MQTEFNLQTYLSEMREELNHKLDQVGRVQSSHHSRLSVLESNQRHLMKIAWGLIAGGLLAAWDIVKNHWLK